MSRVPQGAGRDFRTRKGSADETIACHFRAPRSRPSCFRRYPEDRAPILGLFGAEDRGITPDDVHKFQGQMKEVGKKIEITEYPDAGHQLENQTNPQAYRCEDADDAWEKTIAFLRETPKN